MPSSISERLKALGVKVGAQDIKPVQPPSQPQRLEEVLGGERIQTPQGEAFVVERRFALGEPHGASALRVDAPLDVLAQWAGDERIRSLPPEAIAFMDTETTGLSGGTGTYAFLIGIGRFCGEEFVLQQFFLRDPGEEPAQLAAFEAFLAPCQAIATFNGKTFDVPLLQTRFTFQGLRSPLKDLAHIDLLHLARRLWRDRIPSRTLVNLEVQVLGALRSEQDIPGWMIPQIYFDFLRSGDPEPLKNVLYHNAMDVLSLTGLLDHMAWLLAEPVSLGSRFGIDLIALAKLFEDLGELDRAAQLYIHGLDHEDLHSEQFPEALLLQAIARLAALRKRQNDWEPALQLWRQAADHHHLESHIELAKYYEHQLKDIRLAISWTESALEQIETGALTGSDNHPAGIFEKRQLTEELQHRLVRLQKKTGTSHER